MSHPIEVHCAEVKARLDGGDDFLLLDCREPDEHEAVHIAGAELLPMSEIQQRVGELEPHKEREVVVYCHHGGRSLRVAMWLRGQGFTQASSMAGGIDQWAQEIDATLPRY
jgi:adenylyltransferase/sulfurtransferase